MIMQQLETGYMAGSHEAATHSKDLRAGKQVLPDCQQRLA